MTGTDTHRPTRRSTGFWNLIARRYARQPVADEAAWRHKLDLTRERLRPDMRVLEFGCGTGSTALIHAPHVAQIDAIDYSRAMIDIATEKAREAGVTNVHFAQAAIEDWDRPAESYDAVLAMSILHLVADPPAVLARVRHLLKPGGLFFSSTICLKDMATPIRRVLPGLSALRLVPRVQQFSAEELTAACEAAGFRIETTWRPAPDRALFVIARMTD